MFTRVANVLESTQRQVRVDKMRIAPHESAPFLVSGHSNWASAELLDSGIHLVCFTLQDARECVVCFLDLADNDRLQFAPGVLEVEIGLFTSVVCLFKRAMLIHPVKIVLLVDLPLHLALNTQTDDIGVAFASNCRGIRVNHRQGFLESCDALTRRLLFLFDIVLEVAGQRFDLFDLLGQVCSETTELVDDICLDVSGLVCLEDGLLVVVAEETAGLIQAAVAKQRGGRVGVVDDVGYLEEGLCTVLVRGCDFTKVGDEIFQELAPSCEASVTCATRGRR